jgi:hypothetical protein
LKKVKFWREKRGEHVPHTGQSLEECVDSRFEIREGWMEGVDDAFFEQ